MCILCVVQRWSRRVASMLPYLVIPLMLLWALSHFLPPGFRFEATSPRIACAAVLLLTLLWYEFLLPRLSAWRARRSARLRELRREQALELQKLRKTATRRCRNCLSPYREQNPGGGGRFMCSNCGHVSKRPVLELPGHAGNFGEKNGWFCSQFLSSESGNGYWLDENTRCSSQDNTFSLGCTIGKVFSFFFFFLRWVCRKVFGFGSSGDNGSSDSDSKRNKRGENLGNLQETKVEKSRRKAEEKRLARLEKEALEEEERKQREEVARLVEERRKLRDEKLEAEEKSKGVVPIGEREGKKEHDKKRQDRERRKEKEKDKMSNKSNSDCEDLDRKGKNVGTSHGTNKTSHTQQQNGINRRQYFGTMTGNFRGFSGASFFGGSNQTSSSTSCTTSVSHNKGISSKNNTTFTNTQSYPAKRDTQNGSTSTGTVHNSVPNGDDKTSETRINKPVQTETQVLVPAPKKAWHQLFKRSNPISPSPAPNYQTLNGNNNTYMAPPNNYFNPRPVFNNQPALPLPVYNANINPILSHHQPIFPPVKDPSQPSTIQDESELFEDPSFDPDAIALLGPVSESLGALNGFISTKQSKPSPIESPIARPRSRDEPEKTKSSAVHFEPGSWTLWGAPLTQNALGSVGGNKIDSHSHLHSPRHLNDKRAIAPPVHLSTGDSVFLPHNMMGRFGQLENEISPDISPTRHHWPSKNKWMVNGNGEGTSSIQGSQHGGSLFSTDPAVQSVWSMNQNESK